jgi:hypothetical protein
MDFSRFPTALTASSTACLLLRHNLCISIAYFLSDCIAIVVSVMDLWQLYLFHHVTSLAALFAIVFGGCDAYLVPCACFFVVESTIMPMQVSYVLEFLQLDQGSFARVICGASRHLVFWIWIVARNIPPAFLTYSAVWVPSHNSPSYCPYTTVGCGVGITLFCWGVFASAILPGYLKKRSMAPALDDKRD